MKLLLAILFLSSTAFADDWSKDDVSRETVKQFFVAHLASYHPAVRTYNEINPGIAYRKYSEDTFFAIGTYKNSISKQSVYAGVGIDIAKISNVTASLTVGAITGYHVDVAPFIIPEVSVDFNDFKLIVNYIPKITIGNMTVDAAFGFSAAMKF